MTSYDPISLEYGSFASIERLNKLQEKIKRSNIRTEKSIKKNLDLPGPGSYDILNYWQGKQNQKKNERNFLNKITLKAEGNIYYGSKNFQTYR